MDDKKKYNYMENVLQSINKNFISLPEDEVQRNNKVLQEVLDQIINKMKEKNVLFKTMFQRVFYGGSYYDGLRVGNPEEFDLDLLLKLPKYAEPELTNSNIPGFVHLQLKAMEKFEKQPEAHRHSGLANLLDKIHYLETTKVSAWIEGIVTKALNDFEKSGHYTIIKTSSGVFKAKAHKGGPAFTLKLEGKINNKTINMDVDLVPCFVFTKEKWLPSPYRVNPVPTKSEFFIVPKKPGSTNDVQRYWRLSFQEQERVLINGYRNLKPAVKLLKKLRDMENHTTIASYFIKTIFLWEVEKDKDLWNNSLSYVFMTMLQKYKTFMEGGKIPYYWNKNNNLIQKSNSVNITNIANRLKSIVENIERNPHDPYIVAKYLVQNDQVEKVKAETPIGKKTLKQLQQLQISQPNGSNGMISVKQNSVASSAYTVNTSSSDVLQLIHNVVLDCCKEIDNSTKHPLQSNLRLAEEEIKFATNITSSPKTVSSARDEVDSLKPENNSFTVRTILNAVTKLQDTTVNLQKTILQLQNDNQKLFSYMRNMTEKIDEINVNFKELKKENQMLKNKLKTTHNTSEDFNFLADTLALTNKYASLSNGLS